MPALSCSFYTLVSSHEMQLRRSFWISYAALLLTSSIPKHWEYVRCVNTTGLYTFRWGLFHNLAILSSFLFEDSSEIKVQGSPWFNSKQIDGMGACQMERVWKRLEDQSSMNPIRVNGEQAAKILQNAFKLSSTFDFPSSLKPALEIFYWMCFSCHFFESGRKLRGTVVSG